MGEGEGIGELKNWIIAVAVLAVCGFIIYLFLTESGREVLRLIKDFIRFGRA